MELSQLVIGVLVMSAITVGMSTVYLDLSNSNGIPVTDNIGSFNRLNDTLEIVNEMDQYRRNNVLKNIPILGEIASVSIGAVNLVNYVFSIPGFFLEMIKDLTGMIGLPAWTSIVFQAIILAIILFTLVSIMARYKV